MWVPERGRDHEHGVFRKETARKMSRAQHADSTDEQQDAWKIEHSNTLQLEIFITL